MWRDDAYFLDIVLAARKIQAFTSGHEWEAFESDELLQDAVMRNLQVIGEAARGLSEEARSRLPEVPWAEIVGLRHRLVHDYGGIDLQKVWAIVQEDVAALILALEPLIPPETP